MRVRGRAAADFERSIRGADTTGAVIRQLYTTAATSLDLFAIPGYPLSEMLLYEELPDRRDLVKRAVVVEPTWLARERLSEVHNLRARTRREVTRILIEQEWKVRSFSPAIRPDGLPLVRETLVFDRTYGIEASVFSATGEPPPSVGVASEQIELFLWGFDAVWARNWTRKLQQMLRRHREWVAAGPKPESVRSESDKMWPAVARLLGSAKNSVDIFSENWPGLIHAFAGFTVPGGVFSGKRLRLLVNIPEGDLWHHPDIDPVEFFGVSGWAFRHTSLRSSSPFMIVDSADAVVAIPVGKTAPPRFRYEMASRSQRRALGRFFESEWVRPAYDSRTTESSERREEPERAQPSSFIRDLDEALHAAVGELESQRHLLQRWKGSKHECEGEESLRSRLLAFLKGRNYDATAETDEGGSTDLLVRSTGTGDLWIGECKIHGAYENLDEGMRQLLTRYASGKHPEVGFVLFCFNRDAAAVVAAWKARLAERRPCGMVGEPVDDPKHPLSFSTTHRHEGSGLPVVTRHIVASLYWKPEDRSGRRSRGK